MTHIIYADPDKPVEQEVFPTDSLERLQAVVGGYVEECFLKPQMVLGVACNRMFVNEDGNALGLPANARATFIYAQGRENFPTIRGNVVVGFVNEEGEII